MNIKYLLLSKWLCVNALGFGLLAIAFFNGWVGLAIAADPTRIVIMIVLAFLWGLSLCGWKVWQTSKELNFIRSGELDRSHRWRNYMNLKKFHAHADPMSLIEALKIRQFGKISTIRYIANTLVLMGLVGTVVGFIIALSGVDPSIVIDVSAVAPMVSTLIQGMSVALYTTLVGAIFNIWLTVNYQMLANGTSQLVTAILESNIENDV